MALRYCDFDGDGRSEIPVSSPWGLGILKASGAALSSPMMAANGTRFGGWLLNSADNKFELTADLDGDGRWEIFVASPWGIGVLRESGGTMTPIMMAPNGTRFGGWLLNTGDNRFGPVGDFDGDGRPEILVTSPWGIGIWKLAGNTFNVLMMAPNGTRFGGWLLNTADNRFGCTGDMDGDGHAEIVISSPWGMGILKYSAGALTAPAMSPNGTRFAGGWLLNTADNHLHYAADFDGDGRAEIFITSPWGIGFLKLAGTAITSPIMAGNGTRIGGWLLNTLDNRFAPPADYDGDHREEILLVSPWGIGVLEITGSATLAVSFMAPNGTRFGGWLLNTADNLFDMAGDFDGDGRAELLVTSPWGIGLLDINPGSANAFIMAPNGTRFGGWLLNTADNRFGIGPQLVRLHLKILTTPSVSIETMVRAMQWVYEGVGLIVQRVSTETLNLPALNDLDIGTCNLGDALTAEQAQLYANRHSAGPKDVVAYLVRSLVPPANGCAVSAATAPACAVAQGATQWTLGHEVGHLLGLLHVNDNNRLMTGNGTANITNPPPDLVATEVITMRASTRTHALD